MSAWVRCSSELTWSLWIFMPSHTLHCVKLVRNFQWLTIYSCVNVDLQDISKLFVSKSDFTDNHFTNCTGGGGAISIMVGIVKRPSLMMVCKSVSNTMQLTLFLAVVKILAIFNGWARAVFEIELC